jgi:hypothetical protein
MSENTGPAVVAAWREHWERLGWAPLQGLPSHIAEDLATRIDTALLDIVTAPKGSRARA